MSAQHQKNLIKPVNKLLCIITSTTEHSQYQISLRAKYQTILFNSRHSTLSTVSYFQKEPRAKKTRRNMKYIHNKVQKTENKRYCISNMRRREFPKMMDVGFLNEACRAFMIEVIEQSLADQNKIWGVRQQLQDHIQDGKIHQDTKQIRMYKEHSSYQTTFYKPNTAI